MTTLSFRPIYLTYGLYSPRATRPIPEANSARASTACWLSYSNAVLTLRSKAVLALRGRVPWANDRVSDPTLIPLFLSLPGTSFTVFGAPVPHDSALTSASAQLFFTPNWSVLVKFDGDFASASQTYTRHGHAAL